MNVLIAKNKEECQAWTETAVVIDVLRSATTICQLLAVGKKQVLVFGSPKNAVAFKKQNPGYEVYSELDLGGMEQFDNSPVVASKSNAKTPALITTTAGTPAIVSLQEASNIYIASFCNFSAIVHLLNSQQQDVLLVPSALFGSSEDVEDMFCAEAIKDFIQGFDSLFEKIEEFKITLRYRDFLKGPKTAKEDMKMAFDINATPFVPMVNLVAGTGYGVCTKFDKVVEKKEITGAFEKAAEVGGTLASIGQSIDRPLSPEDTILINETQIADEKNALKGFFSKLVRKRNKLDEEHILELSQEELTPEHVPGRMNSIDEVPLADIEPGAEEGFVPDVSAEGVPDIAEATIHPALGASLDLGDALAKPIAKPGSEPEVKTQIRKPDSEPLPEIKKPVKTEKKKIKKDDEGPKLNLEDSQVGLGLPEGDSSPQPEDVNEKTFDVIEAALRRDIVSDHSVEADKKTIESAEPDTIIPSADTLSLKRAQRFAPEPEQEETPAPTPVKEPVQAVEPQPAQPAAVQQPAPEKPKEEHAEKTATAVKDALRTQAKAAPLGKKAIVLFSGGLDSTTCLYWALAKGYDCEALTVNYGQKHSKEVQAAETIAKEAGVKLHKITLDFPWLAASNSLMDEKQHIPNQSLQEIEKGGIPSTYVPGRNLVFLSVAASLLDSVEADAIVAGPNAVDFSGYPDCTPDFFKAAAAAINRGTKRGVTKGVQVLAPLMKFRKADIIRLAKKLGVPLALTWSCYAGGEKPCGTCDSCKLRAKGFEDAGVKDESLD